MKCIFIVCTVFFPENKKKNYLRKLDGQHINHQI